MPEKRLIDANALDLVPDIHNAMNGVIFVNHPRGGGRTQMIVQQLLTRMISNAPTVDAVEVVRCKDCRNSQKLKMCADQVYCAVWKTNPREDGYCYLGAKMDGGEPHEENPYTL